jgi:hypothetical protein
MADFWSNLGNAIDFSELDDTFSGGDLSSLWSPSNLRTTDILSNIGDSFSSGDLSSLWSPSNLRTSDFLSNLGNLDTSDLLSNVGNVISSPSNLLTNVNDIISSSNGTSTSDITDVLGPSGRDRDLSMGSMGNRDNPYVQTYLQDTTIGGQQIPGLNFDQFGNLPDGGFNLAANLATDTGFTPYDSSTYYGLTNPNLSDIDRLGLYEGISFATASGASEFSKRLAGKTGDVIRVRNPEDNSKYFEASPVRDANGNVVKDAKGDTVVKVDEKSVGTGTGVTGSGSTQTVPTPTPRPAPTPVPTPAPGPTKPGINPLGVAAALGALGGLTGMFNRPDGQQNVPNMPTVGSIQPIAGPQVTVQRPVNIMPGANDPRVLAQQLGAPRMMARGGLAHYARGGGGGQDDKIPAYLSNGEYVIDAATVSDLGDGSNDHGARVLDQFRKNIREHKRSASADHIPPKAKSPLQYLKG